MKTIIISIMFICSTVYSYGQVWNEVDTIISTVAVSSAIHVKSVVSEKYVVVPFRLQYGNTFYDEIRVYSFDQNNNTVLDQILDHNIYTNAWAPTVYTRSIAVSGDTIAVLSTDKCYFFNKDINGDWVVFHTLTNQYDYTQVSISGDNVLLSNWAQNSIDGVVIHSLSSFTTQALSLFPADYTTNNRGLYIDISGNYAVVSYHGSNNNKGVVYEKNISGTWNQVISLPTSIFNSYIRDVAISDSTIVVLEGAVASVYDRDISTNVWMLSQEINYTGGGFGCDISGDNLIIATVTNYTPGSGVSSHVYHRNSSNLWDETDLNTTSFIYPDSTYPMEHGVSVSLCKDKLLIQSTHSDTIVTQFPDGSTTIEGDNRPVTYVYNLCQPTTSILNVSDYSSYTVPSGNQTYYTDTTVVDTLINQCGGDSLLTITIDLYVVGVPENNLTSNFSLYPNPTSKNVTIQLMSQSVDSDLRILSITGKEVLSVENAFVNTSNVEINVSHLTPGIYLVKVGNATQRLVIE